MKSKTTKIKILAKSVNKCEEALEAKQDGGNHHLSSVTVVFESLSVPCVVVLMQVSWCGKEKCWLDLCLSPL